MQKQLTPINLVILVILGGIAFVVSDCRNSFCYQSFCFKSFCRPDPPLSPYQTAIDKLSRLPETMKLAIPIGNESENIYAVGFLDQHQKPLPITPSNLKEVFNDTLQKGEKPRGSVLNLVFRKGGEQIVVPNFNASAFEKAALDAVMFDKLKKL